MRNPGGVTIREACAGDASTMFAWRNDPMDRRWFRSQDPLDWDSHVSWLTSRLADRPTTLWVAERDGLAVGCVRLDLDNKGHTLVSVMVDPEARGTGVGRRLVAWAAAQAVEMGCVAMIAEVHPENVASQALFAKAGFLPQGASNAGFTQYVKPLRPELEPSDAGI